MFPVKHLLLVDQTFNVSIPGALLSETASQPAGVHHERAKYVAECECDVMVRLMIIGTLASNDILDACFSEEQFKILSELGITMYKAVSFYKHRSEGELCNTFAYMPHDLWVKAFWQCYEVLWALDTAWARQPNFLLVTTLLCSFGGGVQSMMQLVHANVKLWYHIDANQMKEATGESIHCYRDVLNRSEEFLFLICDNCKPHWRDFLECFPAHAAKEFPELEEIYKKESPQPGLWDRPERNGHWRRASDLFVPIPTSLLPTI
ncbi:hypothetical protein DFH08DRAFT_822258 [Mycena albidolilacea]|uniref:Uncharacterized protein n=1 Tax=Mycena albidolilacea TaxID=1033008 RepID=A0AAD6Z936_9AGAR|nr:hypothetical protein DFH08DRAFT_822258 [Mycena albidolilacea]